MADDETLTAPPSDARARELWMQHAIGYELMRRMRQYALDKIAATASDEAKAEAARAVENALFGLMELVDGFYPPLGNETHVFTVDLVGRLVQRATGEVVALQSLRDGDGACMGLHLWLDRDFSPSPVTKAAAFAASAPGWP